MWIREMTIQTMNHTHPHPCWLHENSYQLLCANIALWHVMIRHTFSDWVQLLHLYRWKQTTDVQTDRQFTFSKAFCQWSPSQVLQVSQIKKTYHLGTSEISFYHTITLFNPQSNLTIDDHMSSTICSRILSLNELQ